MQGIRLEGLRKSFGAGDTAVDAFKGVDLAVAPGEVIGLIGSSGSGKSTLLKCLRAVIEPSGGRMTLGEEVIYDEGWRIPDRRALRRDRIGFVFQAPYLIPFLDVTDNLTLPLMLAGQANARSRDQARELLKALDVSHRARALPAHISGGEQQRPGGTADQRQGGQGALHLRRRGQDRQPQRGGRLPHVRDG
jgi:putative ABC transport system ATP-binding protein